MKEDPPPIPTKPHNKSTPSSVRSSDDVDMDMYASPEDDFDLLGSEDELEHPIPEELPGLSNGWVSVDARPPPEYSERASSTSTSSKHRSSPAPPKSPIMPMPMPSPSPYQVEQHPLLLHSPQNHDQSSRSMSSPSQGPPPPSSGRPLCMVCKQQPASNDGNRSYATCSKGCQQQLEATRKLPNNRIIMEGQMSNPRSEQTGFLASFWPSLTENPRTSNQIRMCEVCRVRPKCYRGGKFYPTCGLTCAAKLNPPGSVEMCDFCKKRPKAVVNGRTFPQCGKTCRDNARMAIAAAANSATCTTCILCWKAPSAADNSDYCSPVCEVAAQNRAPFLIELPRGHASFRKVADVYVDSWKQTRSAIPRIKRVYMIQIKGSTLENHEQYRSRVNSHGILSRKKGNEQRVWIGIVRECGFGDPGYVEPCSSGTCQLCCVVKSSATQEMLNDGITTTGLLPRAVDMAKNTRRRSSRVVLMAKALYGKVAEWSDNLPPKLPPGYDSVHLTAYTRSGNKLDFQETLVYHKDAIRPLYLITFE